VFALPLVLEPRCRGRVTKKEIIERCFVKGEHENGDVGTTYLFNFGATRFLSDGC
jgi:hypothetical protein